MCSPNFSRVELDEPAAVAGLLLAHAVEYRGGGGKILAQAFGEIGVDALVFLFERDRQGQNFALGQAVEASHDSSVRQVTAAEQAAECDGNVGFLTRVPEFRAGRPSSVDGIGIGPARPRMEL